MQIDAAQELPEPISPISPIGTTVAEDDERWAAENPAYRAYRDARAEFREVAWLLIKYRMDQGLTQQELADRVGTSSTQIARIESGRRHTSLTTLLRIAHALNLKVIIGFEGTSREGELERQTVAL